MKKKNSLLKSVLSVAVFGASAGILHKANYILIATEGSFIEALIALLIGAILMICGGVSILQLSNNEEHGNLLHIFEKNVGAPIACDYSWFQYLICMPAIAVILAWVAGCFTLNLFGFLTSEVHIALPFIIGLGYIVIIFILNYISHHLAHRVQRITTVIKYALFIAIIVIAIIYKRDVLAFSIVPETNNSIGWLGALGSIAFCLEGWYVTISFTKHSHSSKPTLTLVLSCVVIILFYALYLWGMSHFNLEFMEQGNNHLLLIAREYFGEGKLLLVVGLLAMLGGLDTDIMGFIHMPQVIARQGYGVFKVSKEKDKLPINQCIVSFAIIAVWMILHFLFERYHLLHTVHERVESDLAESALIFCYMFFIPLYIKVIKDYKNGNGKFFTSVVCPILATIATLFICAGAIYDNPTSYPFILLIFVAVGIIVAIRYIRSKKNHGVVKTNDADTYTDKFME